MEVYQYTPIKFQSRNRETFDFNEIRLMGGGTDLPFQSRNRETFDFNPSIQSPPSHSGSQFQSRNRETFDFNKKLISRLVVIIFVSIS